MRTVISLLLIHVAGLPSAARADDYSARVKPLLKEKCVACHGPSRSEAGLRLDAAQLVARGSETQPVAMRGKPSESLLIARITTADVDQQMPPQGEGVRLTPEEVAIVAQWIRDGMPAPEDETFVTSPKEHWSFRPIARPEIPPALAGREDVGPIDRLLSQLHAQKGIERADRADPATWLRRVTLDLTGLPPTADEVVRFLADDRPDARERLVDRLFARPAHGERWARHWMDIWRYSDWDGYKEELRGSQRHIWHWREWIVESINADKPYDQMIVEMLAADEIAPLDSKSLRATGFLARNFHRSNRNIWLDATVEHTAKAFLGLTINCARCHDHKYDPISQAEYYQFRAIFEPHDVRTEPLASQAGTIETDTSQAGIPRAYDGRPDEKTYIYQRGNEKQPLKDKPVAPGVPSVFDSPLAIQQSPMPLFASRPALRPEAEAAALRAAWQKMKNARAEADKKLSELESELTRPTASAALDDQAPTLHFDRLANAILPAQVAEAEFESLRSRYAADQAKVAGAAPDRFEELTKRAATAEQRAQLLSARWSHHQASEALAAAKRVDAKDNKKKRDTAIAQAEKKLKTEQEALSKMEQNAARPAESYTPVGPVYPSASTGRRSALARWIVDPRNPLTARVAVNHMWMRHFAAPLSDDVADLGLRTQRPATSGLIDWLADELMASGWDMKHVHRQIVLSQTYALSSSTKPTGASSQSQSVDGENRLFWRANLRRLDAEEIRDSLLATSGQLDAAKGGPDLSEDDGEKIFRRSLYFRHAYEKQVPMLVIFDGASPTECYRRSPSIIPQQALALANSQLVRELSRRLAQTLTSEANDENYFIDQLFLRVLNRPPTANEKQVCLEHLQRPPGDAAADIRRQELAHAMLNHNDVVVAR